MNCITIFFFAILPWTFAVPLDSRSKHREISTSTIYQFPEANRWFENLVVRSNGMILATELTTPKLWLIDPSRSSKTDEHEQSCGNSTIELVHEFPEYLGLLGITEYQPDVFAFIAGNFSIAEGFKSYPGSYAIWSVDFNQGDNAKIGKIADVPDAEFLNGMAYLESDDSLLLADSGLGLVWKLDLKTGISTVAVEDPLMKKVSPDAPDGINGLKVYGDELWFTRGYASIVAKTRIYANGTAVDAAEIVGTGLNSTWTMDDLVVNSAGQAYVAVPFQNLVARYESVGIPPIVIAGNINSTEIAEPTSLAFARIGGNVVDENTIYVATGGAIADPINGHTTVGGQIVRLRIH